MVLFAHLEHIIKDIEMTTDYRKTLLKDLEQVVEDDFNKELIEAYADALDYNDLEQTFREQLIKEVSGVDEN